MATIGLYASWGAALFAAWAFVGGLVGTTSGHVARRSAERALVAAAVAAAVATAALVQLLLAGDVTTSFVARSISTNLSNGYRITALWSLPSGSVLPTATLVAFAGGIAASRTRSPLGVAAVGAVTMALLAASLAAAPFATLPWVPSDGLGLSPSLQHPLAAAGCIALSVAVAAAAAVVALASDHLADPSAALGANAGREGHRADIVAGIALTCVAIAMWSAAKGAFLTGSSLSPAPPTAAQGALVPALVAAWCASSTSRAGGTPFFSAALGALGLLCSVLLAGGASRGGTWALDAFVLVSLGASAAGAAVMVARTETGSARLLSFVAILLLAGGAASSRWLGGGGLQWLPTSAQWLLLTGIGAALLATIAADGVAGAAGRVLPAALGVGGLALGAWLAPIASTAAGWCVVAGLALGAAVGCVVRPPGHRRQLGRAMRLVAVSCAAIAAAGESRATATATALAGGGRTTVAARFGEAIVLSHQGISRFDVGNAHVAAVALEPSRGGRSLPVVIPDRREYVDSRDEILGPPTTRPAVVDLSLEELRITLGDVAPDERVMLQLTTVPFALAWTIALAALVASTLLSLTPRRDAAASPDSPGSPLA